jgi:hypothetical protein
MYSMGFIHHSGWRIKYQMTDSRYGYQLSDEESGECYSVVKMSVSKLTSQAAGCRRNLSCKTQNIFIC